MIDKLKEYLPKKKKQSPEEGEEAKETEKDKQSKTKDDKDNKQDEGSCEDEEEAEGAYLQIFMYYFQIPSLLTINIIYQDNRNNPFDDIKDLVTNVFTFDTISLGMGTCLFKGVDAVFKKSVQALFVAYFFVALGILLLLALLVEKLTKGVLKNKPYVANITLRGRFFCALVNLLLYTYQFFAENSLILLSCVYIGNSKKTYLFIDANQECYKDWQVRGRPELSIFLFVCQ